MVAYAQFPNRRILRLAAEAPSRRKSIPRVTRNLETTNRRQDGMDRVFSTRARTCRSHPARLRREPVVGILCLTGVQPRRRAAPAKRRTLLAVARWWSPVQRGHSGWTREAPGRAPQRRSAGWPPMRLPRTMMARSGVMRSQMAHDHRHCAPDIIAGEYRIIRVEDHEVICIQHSILHVDRRGRWRW